MKRTIAILLTVAMLVSLVIVSTVSVSAVVGDWSVYTNSGSYQPDADSIRDFPGYEYTDDGLHVIPAEWSQTGPWAIAQTTTPVNLRDGVYMEVRVDNFTYYAGDKWFAFEIWETKIDEIPEDEDNYGVEMINRFSANDKDGDGKADAFNALSYSECWHYIKEGERINTGTAKGTIEVDENGKPILTFQVTYDIANEAYTLFINGAPVPDAYNIAVTQYFEERGGEAYISFSAQNSEKAGTVEFTVTKFGTSKEEAETPVGDDSAEPVDNSIEIAEIMDASTVAEGEPAIRLNGSPDASDVTRKPSSFLGNNMEVLDDYSVRVYSNAASSASASFKVANDVSYDAKDFPIMAVIARNFCTCADPDSCSLSESFNTLVLAGNIIQETASAAITVSSASWEADMVDGVPYMLLTGSWEGYEGRINGFRMDNFKMQITEGRNFFDICEVLFFRTESEAQVYYAAYLDELMNGESDGADDETATAGDAATEAPTEAPVDEPTEAPVVDEPTEAPTAAPTEAPTEEPTEAPKAEDPTEAPSKTDDEPKKSGCGGSLGVGAIAVVAFASCALLSFKKKED